MWVWVLMIPLNYEAILSREYEINEATSERALTHFMCTILLE